jgi:hypothetical protein
MGTGPQKILGDIGAMYTLTENFPMSILDYIHTENFTSIYDFILALLRACNIPIERIEERIIEEIYGVGVEITNDIQSIHDRVEEMEWEEDQSPFFQKLENSTKVILMGILSNIMSCSAIPLIPYRKFDNAAIPPTASNFYEIPLKTIDYWDLLSLCPTSQEGYMYYDIRTKTSYHKLIQNTSTEESEIDKTYDYTPVGVYGEINNEQHTDYLNDASSYGDWVVFRLEDGQTLSEDLTINVSYYSEDILTNVVLQTYGGSFNFDMPKMGVTGEGYDSSFNGMELKKAISALKPGTYSATVVAAHGGNENYNASLGMRRIAAMNWYAKKVNPDVKFTYINGGKDDTANIAVVTIDSTDEQVTKTTKIEEHSFSTVIKAGQGLAADPLIINYKKRKGVGCSYIKNVTLNNGQSSVIIGDKNAYLSYELTQASNMYSAWEEGENYSWYKTADHNFYGTKSSDKLVKKEKKYTTKYSYVYSGISKSQVEGTAKEMKYVPTSPDENSPLYIMVPQGDLKTTDLFKAFDLNALIWYTANKGSNIPQVEYNKMMWDTRWPAAKQGIERKTSAQWNQWINSKIVMDSAINDGQLKVNAISGYKDRDNTERILTPIIQLKRGEEQNIFVNFPYQTFYDLNKSALTPSSTLIYTYNWEYLKSIKIYKVRIILHRMIEELLGVRLSSPIKLSIEKKITEAKLRNIINNIIEADDAEVSDCFNTFSNEAYNEAIEEMLLQKYNASYYGTDTTVAQTRNVQEYLDAIDQISPSATAEGTTTQITKLINDISSTPGTEESYGYDFTVSYDLNILKQLVMAITMPIVECVFSPQTMLLIILNLQIMGIVPTDDITGGGQSSKIVNILVNKMFAILKELIYFVKDLIAELLMKLFYEVILPILAKYIGIIVLERLNAWLRLLKEALNCITIFTFKRSKILTTIDDVNYADIVNDQETPETDNEC